mgnify:CR=1 FL=1
MALKFTGGKATSVSSAEKARMSSAITKLEQAIEQARQVASEMMALDGPGLSSSSYHIKDMQTELRTMHSNLSMLRSSLNAIR